MSTFACSCSPGRLMGSALDDALLEATVWTHEYAEAARYELCGCDLDQPTHRCCDCPDYDINAHFLDNFTYVLRCILTSIRGFETCDACRFGLD